MQKYKSIYPTLRQAKTNWSKKKDPYAAPHLSWVRRATDFQHARDKLRDSIMKARFGNITLNKQTKIVREDKIGKPSPSVNDIAAKHKVPVSTVLAQLAKGIEVEKEHTKDDSEAAEIARDHMHEFPDYYDRLNKMEKKAKKDIKEGYDPEVEIIRTTIDSHKSMAVKMAHQHGQESQEAAFHRAHANRLKKQLKDVHGLDEMMSVGSGAIAGMPTRDPPEFTPINKTQTMRRKTFAGRQVFVVDPTTYHKAYLGKRKYEHYEKYLEGSPHFEEIREYGRKNWAEPIIIENEQTGAMVYLKYGSK